MGIEMKEKIEQWFERNREDIEFAYVATFIAAVLYAIVWTVNFLFVSLLSFTGLKYIILPWIGWCVGAVIWMFIEDRYRFSPRREEEGGDDEHQLL